jgi:hypothetical protein
MIMTIIQLKYGIIVTFADIPPAAMFSALRNHGFRWQGSLWFRTPLSEANTEVTIESLRRVFTLYSPVPERIPGKEGMEARGEGGGR